MPGWPSSTRPGRHPGADLFGWAAAASLLHTAAMLATIGAVALQVLGLGVLRTRPGQRRPRLSAGAHYRDAATVLTTT